MSFSAAGSMAPDFGVSRVKTRKCKICREPFHPRSITHKTCKPECAIELAQRERVARQRKESRAKREAIKPRQEWLREAQAAFNAFIRERDKDMPCISCGCFHTGSYDAGHYRSVGACPELRFNEDNVHRQCVPCNQHKSGNVVEFRLGLVARIGVERVAFLEQKHDPRKYSIDDAKAIKSEYKSRLKAMQA